MRTTLDLPDELFRQVKATAALKGATIKELLTRYVERGLRQAETSGPPPGKRSTLPNIPRRGKNVISNLTPAMQAKLEEGDDLAKLRRSLRH